MAQSAVYFTNLRAQPGDNLLQKLDRLINAAGIDNIDFQDKFAAIKIHFGEPGNLAFLRANYARVVVDRIKQLGGRPFLTDANTLYVGRRKHALEHMEAAYENGFSPFSTNCHIIIADGLKGNDEVYVPVDGDYVKEAKIGRAVMDADVFISLSHFKVHECTGIGGALKNIGMGCGSRAGKMEMHNSGKPEVYPDVCIGCGKCITACAQDAITMTAGKAAINQDKCVGCGRCISMCPKDAIEAPGDETNDILNYKIAEYTKAVLDGRPHFHITLVMNVSPYCDCHAENDLAIIPDVGMFASFDPVALDKACTDACNAQTPLPGSWLSEVGKAGDHFDALHPTTNWRTMLDHAEKIGLGSQEYELITVK